MRGTMQGPGHAALCELNYTPQEPDGSIDISKALQVNTEFDLSRQFWAYLVKKGAIRDPQSFVHSVPHMSFVRGLENRTFLKKRFEALSAHPLYYGMEYSEDKKQIGEWIPLVMEGRNASDVVTATRMVTGTVAESVSAGRTPWARLVWPLAALLLLVVICGGAVWWFAKLPGQMLS
jgi:malate dehydrogenase (quinone)